MLLWNINISVGLVNGSVGIIKDFIYLKNQKAPNLPHIIIISFNDYSGPPSFNGVGQEKWVAIEAEKYKWGGKEDSDHYRKQFPIHLAWALTIWKCQGLTIKGLVALQLGESEKEHGLTFVGLSRATDINNIFLGNGCCLERFTLQLIFFLV